QRRLRFIPVSGAPARGHRRAPRLSALGERGQRFGLLTLPRRRLRAAGRGATVATLALFAGGDGTACSRCKRVRAPLAWAASHPLEPSAPRSRAPLGPR